MADKNAFTVYTATLIKIKCLGPVARILQDPVSKVKITIRVCHDFR